MIDSRVVLLPVSIERGIPDCRHNWESATFNKGSADNLRHGQNNSETTLPRKVKSPGFELLLGQLQQPRRYHILDLGSAVGANVQFLSSRLACKLTIGDLFGHPSLSSSAKPVGTGAVQGVLDHLNIDHSSACFDVILGWDLFNYLEYDAISTLSQTVRRFCQPGTLMFLLILTQPRIPAQPTRFRIIEGTHLAYEVDSKAMIPGPQRTPGRIETIMRGFRLWRSFLLRNGVQESIFIYS